MSKYTENYESAYRKYLDKSARAPVSVEVDWDEYIKKDDETARAVHIYTERLVLSSANIFDVAESTQKLWNNPDVMRLYNNGNTRDELVTNQRISSWLSRWKEKICFSGFIVQKKEEDGIVANIALEPSSKDSTAELIFLSAINSYNKGYGKEYAGAVVFNWLRYAFEESSYNLSLPNGNPFSSVVATSRVENVASNKILRDTLGFKIYDTAEKFGFTRFHYNLDVVDVSGNVDDVNGLVS